MANYSDSGLSVGARRPERENSMTDAEEHVTVRDGRACASRPNEAIVSTNKVYAARQHFGSSGDDPRRNFPARPFLVLFPEYEEEIIDILTDYLVGTK